METTASNTYKPRFFFESLENAIEAFQKIGIEILKIHNIEELKEKVFDTDIVDDELAPKVTATDNCLLVCENEDFNKTYLLDLLYQSLSGGDPQSLPLYYVTDVNLRRKIIAPNSKDINFGTEQEREEFEKTLQGNIISVIPKDNDMYIIEDSPYSVLTQDAVDKFIEKFFTLINSEHEHY